MLNKPNLNEYFKVPDHLKSQIKIIDAVSSNSTVMYLLDFSACFEKETHLWVPVNRLNLYNLGDIQSIRKPNFKFNLIDKTNITQDDDIIMQIPQKRIPSSPIFSKSIVNIFNIDFKFDNFHRLQDIKQLGPLIKEIHKLKISTFPLNGDDLHAFGESNNYFKFDRDSPYFKISYDITEKEFKNKNTKYWKSSAYKTHRLNLQDKFPNFKEENKKYYPIINNWMSFDTTNFKFDSFLFPEIDHEIIKFDYKYYMLQSNSNVNENKMKLINMVVTGIKMEINENKILIKNLIGVLNEISNLGIVKKDTLIKNLNNFKPLFNQILNVNPYKDSRGLLNELFEKYTYKDLMELKMGSVKNFQNNINDNTSESSKISKINIKGKFFIEIDELRTKIPSLFEGINKISENEFALIMKRIENMGIAYLVEFPNDLGLEKKDLQNIKYHQFIKNNVFDTFNLKDDILNLKINNIENISRKRLIKFNENVEELFKKILEMVSNLFNNNNKILPFFLISLFSIIEFDFKEDNKNMVDLISLIMRFPDKYYEYDVGQIKMKLGFAKRICKCFLNNYYHSNEIMQWVLINKSNKSSAIYYEKYKNPLYYYENQLTETDKFIIEQLQKGNIKNSLKSLIEKSTNLKPYVYEIFKSLNEKEEDIEKDDDEIDGDSTYIFTTTNGVYDYTFKNSEKDQDYYIDFNTIEDLIMINDDKKLIYLRNVKNGATIYNTSEIFKNNKTIFQIDLRNALNE